MTGLRRKVWIGLLVLGAAGAVGKTCAQYFMFREYLSREFWQPFAKFAEHYETAAPAESWFPYSGMTSVAIAGSLQDVRKLYQPVSHPPPYLSDDPLAPLAAVRTAIDRMDRGRLTWQEKEELELIACKVDMREAEAQSDERIQEERLQRALAGFKKFVGNARHRAFLSEARGWLARVHYLLGDDAAAAKLYLDELAVKDSNIDRETLYKSLAMLFPYNGSDRNLEDSLDEYFDTPRHALFVVNLVTNPEGETDEEARRRRAETANRVIESLKKHEALFKAGAESDDLALALMRASLFMGDTGSALEYSQRVRAASTTAASPEFNWMVASSFFLRREYAKAESLLLKVFNTKAASWRDRKAAAHGLMAVYQKLGRPVDQLHAAFLDISVPEPPGDYNGMPQFTRAMRWPYWGYGQDLPYLVDCQLTDAELEEFLARYPKPVKGALVHTRGWRDENRVRTSSELVKYSLAVRYARCEEYGRAADLYLEIGAYPRLRRMRQLEVLFRRSGDPSLGPNDRLKALYEYGAFLADHSVQIFFNDAVWRGFQTETFLDRHRRYPSGTSDSSRSGLTLQERETFLKRERDLRDQQEEYWRAYQVLRKVAEEAPDTPVGRQAALKALNALRLINTDRFGRQDEIRAADRELVRRLRAS